MPTRDLEDLLGPDERIVHETRQHWYVLVRAGAIPLLGLFVLAILLWLVDKPGWLDNRAGDWATIALWIGVATVAAIVLWRALDWWVERLYLTTSKVVYARGILDRDVTSTPLVKIDEVTLTRPLLGRILGFGRLEVENASGGSEPLAGLQFLPQPVQLYRMLTERSRHQRMVEGGGHRDDDGDGLVDAPNDLG